jgi:phosphoribosylamine--glycine ligase
MLRLQSELEILCDAAIDGVLAEVEARWDPRPSMGLVLAAGGYPGGYATDLPISGLDREPEDGCKVFHAGTRLADGQVLTSGGRVLCVTALGENIVDARERCYRGVATISWDGMTYRGDIGWRAIERYSQG